MPIEPLDVTSGTAPPLSGSFTFSTATQVAVSASELSLQAYPTWFNCVHQLLHPLVVPLVSIQVTLVVPLVPVQVTLVVLHVYAAMGSGARPSLLSLCLFLIKKNESF
jgi:hypothetical protein